MYYLTVEDYFSSAHQLRGYKGKCENLHGHNWKVVVTVKGEHLNSIGILIDFHDLKKLLKKVLAELDHVNLNDIAYFRELNPSSENIARYIFEILSSHLKNENEGNVSVDSITIFESHTSRCTYKL